MSGQDKRIGPQIVVPETSQVFNTTFGQYCELGAYNTIENCHFDDFSYTGPYCIMQNVQVGKYANIAANVRIGPTDHPYKRPSLHHFTYRPQIFGFAEHEDIEFFDHRYSRTAYIGHDTWIGHGAIIMPEVKIGDGAIIGSGAVATKDIPPYAIAVGLPAKVIKYRFEPEIIAALQEIKWWDWPVEVVKERLADFQGDIETFVAKYLPR